LLAVISVFVERRNDFVALNLLILDPDAFLLSWRGQLVALASRYAVPVI
jgi:hypothetical protein